MKKLKKKEKNKENIQSQQKKKMTDPVLIAKALICTEGNDYNASEMLGINVRTLRKHIKNNDVLKDVKDHLLSKQLAFVEERLMNLIALNDFQAIKYFLENKGKDAGWGKNSSDDGSTQKTGVLLINNFNVNNTNLNPRDWAQIVQGKRQSQKAILDDKSLELELNNEE